MLFSAAAFAQVDRYLKPVFDDVKVTPNVVYGQNTTLLFTATQGPVKQPLLMDVYEPMADPNTSRPLVILMHTGNFLPRIVNGSIQGTRQDSSAVEISTRLAKMGYVVASIDYRLGWNPAVPSQPLRALGLIQAAYRGIQDGRTAVRYFRADADGANTFQINSDRIAIWGNGTGGYIGLGMATLDNYNEILMTEMPQGKFFFDHDNDAGTPDIPMVLPDYHGDIEGKDLVIAPADGFGFSAGDTSNFSNHAAYSSDVDLVLNVGGALGDIAWLDENTPPIISYHHYKDPFAPYESRVLTVPGTLDNIVEVQGSKTIAEKQNTLGNNDVFVNANTSDVWTDAAKANSTVAGHDFMEALYPMVSDTNVVGFIEGVVIDWWDPNAIAPDVTNPNGLPWNQLPNTLADPTGNTSFHLSGIAQNFGMSADKARTNIDTIIGFFAPRAYVAMDLGLVNTNDLTAEDVNLAVAPNPASSYAILSSNVDSPMRDIKLYDLSGRLLDHYDAVNNHQFMIHRRDNITGMYVVQITFDEGVVSKKLLFN